MPSGSLLGPKGARLIGDMLAGGSVSTVPRDAHKRDYVQDNLFDVRFAEVEGENHAFVYIGFGYVALFDEAVLEPYATPTESDGWIDVGEWVSSAYSIELLLVAASSDVTAYGDAVWRIAGKWCISIDGEEPSGYSAHDTYRRVLFAIGDDGWHKLCSSPVQFSSRPCDAERSGASGTNKRSIDTERYDGMPVLQLYGFDDPTTVDNPWASDTPPTGVTNSDWMLVLRRVKNNGDVEIQYMPLAQVAGSPTEDGQPDDPEQPEPVQKLVEAPCNDLVDHVTLYAWNPCTNSWVDLADGDDPVFWRSGGDESTCYGSCIGNENGTEVIHLGGRAGGEPELKGPVWNCEGEFNCDGSVNSTIGFYAGNTAAVTPGIVWARDNVQTNIVNCNQIEIGGVFFAPKQITYVGADGRQHTETVLAAQ